MGKLKDILRLIRPLNCLMMAFAVVVGASLATTLNFSFNLLMGAVTAFALTAASMVMNDYYDREIDAINEPTRPIPKGVIRPEEALVYATAFGIVGLAAALQTNIESFLVAIIAMTISLSYISKGKKTGLLGNFLVSTTVVIPFVYGGLAVGQIHASTLIFVAIVFLSNTAREITKGIVDVKGDRANKITTIAVTYGEHTAAAAASFFTLLAIILSPLPCIWGLVTNWFLPMVIITDIGLLASTVLLLRDYSRKNAKRTKNLALVWFTTGLMAFILGKL